MARHPGSCAFKIRTHQLGSHGIPAVERPGAGSWSSPRGSVNRRHWLKRQDLQRRRHLLPPGSRQAVAAASRGGAFVFGERWCRAPREMLGTSGLLAQCSPRTAELLSKTYHRVSLWRLGSSTSEVFPTLSRNLFSLFSG